MSSGGNSEPFPKELPWEAYTEYPVTIEALRERRTRYVTAVLATYLESETKPALVTNGLGPLLDSQKVDRTSPSGSSFHEDLYAIGLWYMLPAAQRAADADVDATRRYLKDLERRSQEIWPALHHVVSLLPGSIAEHLAQMPEWVEGDHELDLPMIKQFVRLLPEISRALARDVQVRRRGRPSNFVLDHSADLAQSAFKRAGREVEPRGQSATAPSARLVGDGAELFVDYFRLLDGHLNELGLAQALLRNRSRAKRSRTQLRAEDAY